MSWQEIWPVIGAAGVLAGLLAYGAYLVLHGVFGELVDATEHGKWTRYRYLVDQRARRRIRWGTLVCFLVFFALCSTASMYLTRWQARQDTMARARYAAATAAAGTPAPTSTLRLTSETTAVPQETADTLNCTLDATFGADVTVPDDTRVEPGQSFTKTWRVRNTGTCDWGAGYRLTFTTGDQMAGPDSVTVPETPAGESAEISVGLVAPQEEGRYRGYWQMCVSETECFGDEVYVQIVSSGSPAPTASPTSQP